MIQEKFFHNSVCQFCCGSENDQLVSNSLRTTWGPDPTNAKYFVKQPLTIEEAKLAGFKQIPGKCRGKFLGYRYILNEDLSLILIYNNNGDIAGIQMAVSSLSFLCNFLKENE